MHKPAICGSGLHNLLESALIARLASLLSSMTSRDILPDPNPGNQVYIDGKALRDHFIETHMRNRHSQRLQVVFAHVSAA